MITTNRDHLCTLLDTLTANAKNIVVTYKIDLEHGLTAIEQIDELQSVVSSIDIEHATINTYRTCYEITLTGSRMETASGDAGETEE